MVTIEKAIVREVGSFRNRTFWVLITLNCLKILTAPSNLILLVFCAVPQRVLDQNPHGRNAQSIITEWDLTGSRSWISGLLQSVQFFGLMFGGLVFGQLSDSYGRKKVATTELETICCAERSFGFCGGNSVAETSLFQEFCGPDLWSFNGIVLGSLGYSVNVIIHVSVAYYFPDWRTLCFLSSAWSLLSLIYFCVIPESPRWLFSTGRIEEAERVMARLTEDDNDEDGSVDENPVQDDRVDEDDYQREYQETLTQTITALDVLRHPTLMARLFIMGLQWFNASFMYYGISLGSGALSPDFYWANIVSALSTLPGLPLLMFLMGRKWSGRRKTLAAFNLLAAVTAFLAYILPHNENSLHRLVLVMLGKLGISAAYDLIYIYTPEMFPTLIRSGTLGAMSTCARIGGIFAPFLANAMISSDSQSPLFLFGIISAACGASGLFLPETLGKAIPNTMEDLQEELAFFSVENSRCRS